MFCITQGGEQKAQKVAYGKLLILKNIIQNQEINLDNELIDIPSFLISRKFNNMDKKMVYYALKFIGNYIDKKILKPNSLHYSKSRLKLENLYK